MHLITIKMGVVMFNRQFFIYLERLSIGVSLDISRHTLLTINEISHDDFVQHQTDVPLIILSSVYREYISQIQGDRW